LQKDKTYSKNIPALWQNVKREKAVCLRCKKIDSILLKKQLSISVPTVYRCIKKADAMEG